MAINIEFKYATSERALPLANSKGGKKSRIHLFDYQGEVGKDRFAVAAKLCKVKSESPRLNCLERKFFILLAHQEKNGDVTWYKINKNSLKKRLGLSAEMLKGVVDGKTGVAQSRKIESLIVCKLAQFINMTASKSQPISKPENTLQRTKIAKPLISKQAENAFQFDAKTAEQMILKNRLKFEEETSETTLAPGTTQEAKKGKTHPKTPQEQFLFGKESQENKGAAVKNTATTPETTSPAMPVFPSFATPVSENDNMAHKTPQDQFKL